MSDGDLFYVCGIALAVSAVLFSLAALRLEKFPGRATPVVVLWFALLIGGATSFAVLHAKEEEKEKAGEFAAANETISKEEASSVDNADKAPSQPTAKKPTAKGSSTTLKLAAEPSELAFDTTKLTSKAGKITIDFDNPAALEHNVAIEENGKQIAVSETIASGRTSVSADLEPGTYTFLCTVPGHAEAGMQGTLVVK